MQRPNCIPLARMSYTAIMLGPDVRTHIMDKLTIKSGAKCMNYQCLFWSKFVQYASDSCVGGMTAFLNAYDSAPSQYRVPVPEAVPPAAVPAEAPPADADDADETEDEDDGVDESKCGFLYCFNTMGNPLIYKAGMTQGTDPRKRLLQYTGPSKPKTVLLTLCVSDARTAESRMLDGLQACRLLKHRPDLGREWFEAIDYANASLLRLRVTDAILSHVHRKRKRAS
jgi:hypothetical protein